MIEFVQLVVTPGVLIGYLRLLLVAEHKECGSGPHSPGMAKVTAVSLLVVGYVGWVFDTPGMEFEKYESVLDEILSGGPVGVLMLCRVGFVCL